MIHLRRSALALVAVASVVIASGCSGSNATPTPKPITDPSELIAKVATSSTSATSFHLKVDISGKLNASALSGGSTGLTGSYDLAGTTLEGDVDVTKQATDLKLAVPALLGTTGEVIVVDGTAYYKISLQGDKFTKIPLSSLTGSLPVAVPSVGAVASGNMTDEIDQLQKAMTAAGVTTKMMPNEQVGGKDAYHVQVTLPLDTINAALASDSSTTGMKLDSAGLDFWVYSDTYLPAKIEIKGSASTAGNLDLVVTLTDYGKAVTITAPSADQITG